MSTIDRATLETALHNLGSFQSYQGFGGGTYVGVPADALATVVAAARAHLKTLPQIKMVAAWHVEFSLEGRMCINIHTSQSAADKEADAMKTLPGHYCIFVSGPHKHCVPA